MNILKVFEILKVILETLFKIENQITNNEKLDKIENLIEKQSVLHKETLSFKEGCEYAGFSESHMYKLTASNEIPFFRPNSKKIYFNRKDLDQWLQRNRVDSKADLQRKAANHIIKNRRNR